MSREASICIVDDEKDIVDSLAEYIKDVFPNVKIDKAFDGSEGWNLIKDNKYTLVITDLNMPGLEGNDLVGNIMSKEPDQRPECIIILSGFIKPDPNEESFSNVHLFSKPIDWDRFEELLKKYL